MSTWAGFSERSGDLIFQGDPSELPSSRLSAVVVGADLRSDAERKKSTSVPGIPTRRVSTERCAAMQELIANSKETLTTSRDVSFSDSADFSFARRAVSELKEGRHSRFLTAMNIWNHETTITDGRQQSTEDADEQHSDRHSHVAD